MSTKLQEKLSELAKEISKTKKNLNILDVDIGYQKTIDDTLSNINKAQVIIQVKESEIDDQANFYIEKIDDVLRKLENSKQDKAKLNESIIDISEFLGEITVHVEPPDPWPEKLG